MFFLVKKSHFSKFLSYLVMSKVNKTLQFLSRWWFQTFFIFTPKIGEDFQLDEHIFQMGGSTTNQLCWTSRSSPTKIKKESFFREASKDPKKKGLFEG